MKMMRQVFFWLFVAQFVAAWHPQSRKRIVGGKPASIFKHPYVAAIFIRTKDPFKIWTYTCGGTILTRTVIVTTARCITRAPKRQVQINPRLIRVVVGADHIPYTSMENVQGIDFYDHAYGPHTTVVHQQYDPNNRAYNLGLLFLKRTLVFGPKVQPAVLDDSSGTGVWSGHWPLIAGFGQTETLPASRQLIVTTAQVRSQLVCPWMTNFATYSPYSTICFTFEGKTGTCVNDQGNGIIKENQPRGNILIGIVLDGPSCLEEDKTHFGLKISTAREWIQFYIDQVPD